MKRVALLVVSLALAGCSILPLYTRANERLVEDARRTRATREIAVKDLPKGVFVGIAISGGGSRAANFSARVPFELAEPGHVPRVSARSSSAAASCMSAPAGL